MGTASFMLNEWLAPNAVGLYITFLVAALMLVGSLFKPTLVFIVFIIFIISSSAQSRNFDDIVAGIELIPMIHNTFNASIGGLPSVSLLVLIGLACISLLRILRRGDYSISTFEVNGIALLFVLLLSSLIGAFIFSLERTHLSLSYLISDMRLPLVLILSAILLHDMKHLMGGSFVEIIGRTIVLCSLINGFEAILCVIADYIDGRSVLMIGTQPGILMPAFFMILYLARNITFIFRFLILLIVLLGAFRFSRGDIIYALLLILAYFTLVFSANTRASNKLKDSFRLIFFLAPLFIAIPLILPFISDRLWAFLLFKLGFFMSDGFAGGNSGTSASVRLYEWYNISEASLYYLLFGKGLGSYFTFSAVQIPYELTLSDFSMDQISSGYFYKPHTFVNTIILKYGFIGLAIYVSLALSLYLKARKLISISGCFNTQAICIFIGSFSIYTLNMYWQPLLVFIFVVCVYMINTIAQQNKVGSL